MLNHNYNDDECAMRKAMEHSFPLASFVMCVRHIRENVVQKLGTLLGTKSANRHELIHKLFGDDGPSSWDDVLAFDAAIEAYRTTLANGPPEFANYVKKSVVHLLQLNAAADRPKWTNNFFCESISHILKHSVQWKLQQLQTLISKISDVIDAQHIKADRALCGHGKFMLALSHAKHRMTVDRWKGMTAAQRRKASDACFKLTSYACSTSTDDMLTVASMPGTGKKLHQRKRKRAKKTKTLTLKKRPCVNALDSSDDFARMSDLSQYFSCFLLAA